MHRVDLGRFSLGAGSLLAENASADGEEACELALQSITLDGVGLGDRVNLSRYVPHHASKLGV